MPAVSIIIPTYNREHVLGRSIKSVLNQSCQDFELIIVDDGSTDSTENLVKSFDSEKIKYIQHGENRGTSAARNSGIRSAKGAYIAFQDSDDEWLPEKLAKQIRVLETAPPEVGIVCTGSFIITNNRKKYKPCAAVAPKDGNIFSNVVKGIFVCTQVALIKRECFERAGMFDERFPAYEDWDLFLRMSRHYQFICIDEPLVLRYRQPDSTSVNLSAVISGYKLMMETYFEDIKQDKRVLAGYYFVLGHFLCSYGELNHGRSYFIKSARANPLDIKVLGALLISLLGKGIYNIVAKSYREILEWFSIGGVMPTWGKE